MANKFKISAAQMNCVPGDVEANLETAVALMERAADEGAVLVVVPELFDTGYWVEERDWEFSSTLPGPTTKRLAEICSKRNLFVTGTSIERDGNDLYDTAFLVGPDGLVGTYRKNFLWDGEKKRFKSGAGYHVFDAGICKIGMQICYEIGFPESARVMIMKGADILVYPSAFGASRAYAWDIASRARALENGCYLVACNRSGSDGKETEFAANSRIVGPQGNILASTMQEYDVVTAMVDLDEIKRQREAIPYLNDLRRDFIANYYRE
jgi:predicted amidohydrolase